jgi:hypothetical protein
VSTLGKRTVIASCAALVGACGGAPGGPRASAGDDAGADGVEAGAPACLAASIEDPDFTGGASWTPIHGATLAPGAAIVEVAAICEHGGVTQALPASPLGCARPLVLTAAVSQMGDDKLGFAVGVGLGWTLPVLGAGDQTVKVCLGADMFGVAPNLFVGVGSNPWLCPPPLGGSRALVIRHVSIDADVVGDCPLPGTVPNGDFERGGDGWTFKPGDTAVAEVAPGLGEGGSAAAHLATAHVCERPSFSGRVSLPTHAVLPNPALRVWANGTSNATISLRIGSLSPTFYTGATYLRGRGAPAVTDVCVAPWAEGTVQPFEVAYVPTRFTEDCVTPSVRDFVIDGLAFVSDDACAAGASLRDGGFEQLTAQTAVASFWALERYDDAGGSDVALVTDGAAAHGGAVLARFSASSPCPHASLSGGVTVPAPAGGAGPALGLWYETNTAAHSSLAVSMNALAAPLMLPLAAGWTHVTACLDPHLATRPDLLRVSLASVDGGGTCADTFPGETVGLDDVTLGTDPSCPAQ